MSTPTEKLTALGLTLPPVAEPVGAYVPAIRTGNLIFTSGQLPAADGELIAKGKVGSQVAVGEAQGAARAAALNALAAAAGLAGGLDNICRIIRLNVFVNSEKDFTDQAKVANGASELLKELFGEAGRHTRCAIGAAELPLNAAVELDLIVEVGE